MAHGLGYEVAEMEVHHRARAHGHSKFGFERYFRGLLDLFTVLVITRYGRRPGHFFGGIGIVAALAGFLILTYLTGVWLFTDDPIGNRPLLTLGVLLEVVAVQLLAVGILAELILHRTTPRPAEPGPGDRRPRGAPCFVRGTSAAPERCGGRRSGRGSRAGWPGDPAVARSTSDRCSRSTTSTPCSSWTPPGGRSGRSIGSTASSSTERGGTARVFEFGAGASTPWLARRSAEVHAVEYDAGFAAHIEPVVREAGATLHVVPGVPSAHPRVASAKRGHVGEDFERYVATIDEVGGPFDLVVIDGRAREEALVRSLPHLAPGGVVLLDDAWRARYRAAVAAVPDAKVEWLWGLAPEPPVPVVHGAAAARAVLTGSLSRAAAGRRPGPAAPR